MNINLKLLILNYFNKIDKLKLTDDMWLNLYKLRFTNLILVANKTIYFTKLHNLDKFNKLLKDCWRFYINSDCGDDGLLKKYINYKVDSTLIFPSDTRSIEIIDDNKYIMQLSPNSLTFGQLAFILVHKFCYNLLYPITLIYQPNSVYCYKCKYINILTYLKTKRAENDN